MWLATRDRLTYSYYCSGCGHTGMLPQREYLPPNPSTWSAPPDADDSELIWENE